VLADYLIMQSWIVRRNTPISNCFNARIYEAVTKTSEYLSPKVVAIAEQLVKVFIDSFCNATFSETPAKTENFGENLNTVGEKKIPVYIYLYAVYLSHGKFLNNADPDLNKYNVGLTDRAKK